MAQEKMRLARPAARPITKRLNLTEASVGKLACSPGKTRMFVYDSKTKGLAVQLTAGGSKSYYFYGRVKSQHRPIKFHLGTVGQVPLDTARRRAMKIASDAAHGLDPAAERREEAQRFRNAISIKQLWQSFRDEHVIPKLAINTLLSDELQAKKLAPLFATQADKLTRAAAQEHHGHLTRTIGKATADAALRLLSRMYTWKGIEPHPIKGLRFHGDTERDRFLSREEIALLMKTLDEVSSQTVADVIRLALFTGVRKTNVRTLRWTDLHIADGLWIIAGLKHKNGRPVLINLLPPAIELLKRRRAMVGNSEWVFPGRDPTKPIHNIQHTWEAVRIKAKITDVHFHDLRHTLASWMAISGASMLAIGKQLGHAHHNSTARYAHLDVAAVRPLTGNALTTMLPKKTKAKRKIIEPQRIRRKY